MTAKIIYIDWEGPYSFDEVAEFDDAGCDYGLYQIYGNHPLYGEQVLLYLGATDGRTFAEKLADETDDWELEVGLDEASVYLGHLSGPVTPEEDVWQEEIDLGVKFLTYVHNPVFNARPLGVEPHPDFRHLHIVNQGDYGDLEKEISYARYLMHLENLDDFDIYGKHGEG